VHRIAIWYQLGHLVEEIVNQYQHLTLAQVYAALAYYHANHEQIEAEADRIEKEFLNTRKSA
jgi:uncharacterized protein (DUF433 family)